MNSRQYMHIPIAVCLWWFNKGTLLWYIGGPDAAVLMERMVCTHVSVIIIIVIFCVLNNLILNK